MRKNKKNITKKYISGLLTCSFLVSNSSVVLAVGNTKETVPTTNGEWELVWNDEFNGTSLDRSKWNYDVGNWIVDGNGNKVDSGWGNQEVEYYTEGDNLSFKDGNLVITAKREDYTDPVQGDFEYTSSKIKTHDLFAKKYGRFEARVSSPDVAGLWPAFWMMPEDDVYGGWASSGEIDIMELRGRVPNQTTGAIHYGGKWPNNTHVGGSYDMPEGQDITEFHTYAVEWEPGEIRWYLDDTEIFKKNNWYSLADNGEKYSFPAPFDQDFYIILNLAVGGWFDGGITPSEEFKEAEMLVDYVRVYDKVGGYEEVTSEPTVEKEPLPEGAKLPVDGNYIYDVNYDKGFKVHTVGNEEWTNTWNFLTLGDFGGAANIGTEAINGSNFAKIDISNVGTENYSVQLIQNVTLTKGHTYKLSYDAKASGNREMAVKLSAGEDRGWETYSPTYNDALGTEVKSYEHVFTVDKDSNVNARLELNLGLNDKSVWIGNVKLEECDEVVDYDAAKAPLKNGNHIYNGNFDKGLVNRLTYWNLVNSNNATAEYSVPEATRELFIDVTNGGSNLSDVTVNQKGIRISTGGEYELTFNARTNDNSWLFKSNKEMKIAAKDSKGNIIFESESVTLDTEMKEYKVNFSIGELPSDNNGIIEFWVGGSNGDVYLDNIVLKNGASLDIGDVDQFPLKNGDFSQGLQGWDNWSAVGAKFASVDGKAVIDMPNKFWDGGDGAQTWAVQLKQTGLQLYKGLEYVVSFDASSTIEREFELVAQNSNYFRHFEKKVAVGSETKRYTYSFVPGEDDLVELNFLLGKFGEYEPHSVTIDNVIFEVKNPNTNLVKNYNFVDGQEPWGIWSNAGSNATVADEKLEVNVPSLGDAFWSTQVYQNPITLEEGKSYRLTFDMSSSLPRDIQVLLEGSDKYLWETIKVDEELKTYTTEFVYNKATENNVKFLFALGKIGEENIGSHVVTIDNVYLNVIPDIPAVDPPTDPEPPTPEVNQNVGDKLINDGDFTTELGKWSLWKEWADADVKVNEGQVVADIRSIVEGRTYDPQFIRGELSLAKGNTYKLSFKAKADKERPINVSVGQPLTSDPWFIQYLEPVTVDLTTEMQEFTHEFTVENDNTITGQMVFELGEIAGTSVATKIYLDDINIEVVGTPDEPVQPEALNIKEVKALDNITVKEGTSISDITLPETVEVVLEDDSTKALNVTWDTTSFDSSKAGEEVIIGTIELVDGISNNGELKAQVTVVVEEVAKLDILSIEKLKNIKVSKDTSSENIGLPESIEVTLENGTTKDVALNWNVEDYNATRLGAQDIFGELQLEIGTTNTQNLKAHVKVVVNNSKK